jgi:predicted permease
MLAILLKTAPFFAVMGLGCGAGRLWFFNIEATAYLTEFVFYCALSAMLFGLAANRDLGDVFCWAYFLGSALVWGIVTGVARIGSRPLPDLDRRFGADRDGGDCICDWLK